MIDPASEEGKKLGELYQKENFLRGAYLDQAVVIERIIGYIISLSLCSNVDSRLTFDRKLKILKRLLESKYPIIVNKHEDVFEQIDKVRQFRNILAHGMLDTSDEFLTKNYTDRIQLEYYDSKGHRQMIEITDTDIREKLRNCSELVTELTAIQSEITQSKSGFTSHN